MMRLGFEKSSPLAKVFTRRGVTTPEFQGIEGELPRGLWQNWKIRCCHRLNEESNGENMGK
jgi:hypothetical protein